MTILYSNNSSPIKWPISDAHDPNSKKYYHLIYRSETWNSTQPYIKGIDVVLPTASNGCMYECVSGGISNIDEPLWNTKENKFTQDRDVLWKCLPDLSLLKLGDTITSSTWTSESWVVLSNINSIQGGRVTSVKVESMTIPTSALNDLCGLTMSLVNHVTILRADGRIEELEKTIIVPIKET